MGKECKNVGKNVIEFFVSDKADERMCRVKSLVTGLTQHSSAVNPNSSQFFYFYPSNGM